MSDDRRRLFLAWMVPREVATEVAARVVEELGGSSARRSYRLPRAEGLHVTALFLGDVVAAPWLAARDELAGACRGLPAPTLRLDRAGAFPGFERPRVLWLGLAPEGVEVLGAWRERLVARVRARGFEGEDLNRPFRPHVTVARPRRPGPTPAAFREGTWDVTWRPAGLSLVESVPADRGPRRYEERFRVDAG